MPSGEDGRTVRFMHLAKYSLYKRRSVLSPSLDSRATRRDLRFRAACAADGGALWRLVGEVGTLERNSAYAYLLMASDFGTTCLVAEDVDGTVAGGVIGFRPPREPDCAFVWQVGVRPDHRGVGVALAMLKAWWALPAVRDARWLTATVADDNRASQALFRRLAETLRVPCEVRPRFTAEAFPPGHPAEPEYRLGPFRPPARDP